MTAGQALEGPAAEKRILAEASVVVALAAVISGTGHESGGLVVAGLFLGACHWRSWRHDDARVLEDGLGLGGLAARLPHAQASFRRAIVAFMCLILLTFPLYVWAWVGVVRPVQPFAFARAFTGLQPFAEVLLVALPEEAFFRGLLQSRLHEASPSRWRLLTRANVLASALFALGHFGTGFSLARASVFFPSLLFGALRERTGGIVVSVLFHALCNLLSHGLAHGFAL